MIYFGTLAQRTEKGHEAIQGFLSAREPGTRSLYDINPRPDCYNEKIIRASLRQCDVLKINIDELHIIKTILGLSSSEHACIGYLMQHYGIEVIALTKGKDGSELFTATDSYQLEIDPIDLAGDAVGAGDAFASILSVGYLNQWHPVEIIEFGKSGYLLNTSKPELIAASLEEFVSMSERDKDFWTSISENAIKRVQEHFNWKSYSQRLIKLTKLYGFWRFAVSGKGMLEMDRYCDVLYHFLIRSKAAQIENQDSSIS